MEQNPRVKLITATHFNLPMDELKKFYIYFALSQYKFLRTPEYNEKVLLRVLNSEIKKLLIGAQELSTVMPNNQALSKILAFFNTHSEQLSLLKGEYTKSE